MILRAFLSWLPMVAIAVANGVLRQAVLMQSLEERAAHQVSTVLLLSLLTIYIGWISLRWPLRRRAHAAFTGLIWVVLTLGFEFGLGRAQGLSWSAMLAEYDIVSGRLWVVVPLWIGLSPLLFFHLRR